ncbi:hypothetical protein [Thauera linaloolentis]|uniref:hypothetical protein n=1 Tax=Thauera linaloolentis TaxID=76112 RepID=UPI00030272D6|nr:hypothetical protein [Thauera linaloolentis]MCM8564060.1 hypothetical protein [Thauera linaloolentis]
MRQALRASLAAELQETSAAGCWLAQWSGRLAEPKVEDASQATDADAARLRHLLCKHVK